MTVGVHTVPFTKVVYIERSDFREVDSPDYFRLALGKTVGLMKAPYPITATSIDKDSDSGLIRAVHARFEKPIDDSPPKKPKSWIHWVGDSSSHNSPIKARVRIINSLFKSDNPAALGDGLLNDINPDSETYYPDAMIEAGFEEIRRRAPWPAEAGEKSLNAVNEGSGESATTNNIGVRDASSSPPGPETVRFQGMRMGYFCVDKDSTKESLLLNRIVSLKEDSGKD